MKEQMKWDHWIKSITLKDLNKEWLELLFSYKKSDFSEVKCAINNDDDKYGKWNDKTFAQIAINCLEHKWKVIAEEIIAKFHEKNHFSFNYM